MAAIRDTRDTYRSHPGFDAFVAAKETLVDAVRSIRGRNLVRGLGLARGRIPGPRDWVIWELPRWVACFVILVVLTDAVVLTVEASKVSIGGHDLALFAGLLICSAATVELTRRVGENLGLVKDVYAVWELPAVVLLPLAYVPVLPAIRFALTQWRIKRVPVYRRVFSAAAIGLSYVTAALVFRLLIQLVPGAAANPAGHALAWMPFVAIGAAVQWIVNQSLVLTAIKGSNPDVRLRDERNRLRLARLARRAVRQGADVQRRQRAVRGGAGHVLRGL